MVEVLIVPCSAALAKHDHAVLAAVTWSELFSERVG